MFRLKTKTTRGAGWFFFSVGRRKRGLPQLGADLRDEVVRQGFLGEDRDGGGRGDGFAGETNAFFVSLFVCSLFLLYIFGGGGEKPSTSRNNGETKCVKQEKHMQWRCCCLGKAAHSKARGHLDPLPAHFPVELFLQVDSGTHLPVPEWLSLALNGFLLVILSST